MDNPASLNARSSQSLRCSRAGLRCLIVDDDCNSLAAACGLLEQERSASWGGVHECGGDPVATELRPEVILSTSSSVCSGRVARPLSRRWC